MIFTSGIYFDMFICWDIPRLKDISIFIENQIWYQSRNKVRNSSQDSQYECRAMLYAALFQLTISN